jgi:ornithine decarboxylase
MGLSKTIWTNPSEFIRANGPESPVLLFSPAALQANARRFIDGFPGLVTYAVKSNPHETVIENLAAAGVRGYDVASPFEMRIIARLCPDAAGCAAVHRAWHRDDTVPAADAGSPADR